MDPSRHSYATEGTTDYANNKYETGYGYPTGGANTAYAGRPPAGYQPSPQDYRYGDGTYDRV